LRLFRSRDYAIVLIHEGDTLVHRTCLLPAHFRFPFMKPGELQTAGIWTRPDKRGLGLGLMAMRAVFQRLEDPGRTLWYMVREDNHASIRLAEKAGFRLWGRGGKRVSPGLGLLGKYHIIEGSGTRAPDLEWPARALRGDRAGRSE
jgi:RimJ/RimL family protein N-acetyltransferase